VIDAWAQPPQPPPLPRHAGLQAVQVPRATSATDANDRFVILFVCDETLSSINSPYKVLYNLYAVKAKQSVEYGADRWMMTLRLLLKTARRSVGHEVGLAQSGHKPSNWKSVPSVCAFR
jgi:hypothetical protein